MQKVLTTSKVQQKVLFGHGLDDDALTILASAKTRIYKYFLGVELRSEDLVWRRTLSSRLTKFEQRKSSSFVSHHLIQQELQRESLKAYFTEEHFSFGLLMVSAGDVSSFLSPLNHIKGIKLVELVDGVCWGCVFFFLISTQSYQGIKLVELVDGVCWGCVFFFLISTQSYQGIKLSHFKREISLVISRMVISLVSSLSGGDIVLREGTTSNTVSEARSSV
ncbi:hypothetical protein LAZ67_2005099 [Cordylochernes scorpioides]|uniref:Uncharacterized protein n=1 Tax=Cordylochernes scorpioides TaxID=51811 RepID=A0ABY6K4A3_9ARAC|nr:hypothetical protein LAZ67_2005099 [Cordylochernes scorpioides]